MNKFISNLSKLIHMLKHLKSYNLYSRDGNVIKIKKPSLNDVILDSETIRNTSDIDQAIKFVKHFNTFDIYTTSIILLHANKNLDSDEIWLEHFNNYLSSFGMSKLTLNDSHNSKYYRLSTHSTDRKFIAGGNLVSILMTSFNSEKTISLAINSILDQTWKNIELIVIDDLSTDHTCKIIKNLATKDKRIKLIQNKYNIGTYASKNIGLLYAEGEYITCHDSDDWAHPERIEKHVMRMIQDKEVASMILKVRVTETMEVTRFKRVNTSCIDGITHYSLPSIMFKHSFFKEKLGNWDCIRFSADKELYERTNIALKGKIKKYKILGQICLETPHSLTNNPAFGLKQSKNKLSARKKYRNSYREWHHNLTSRNTYLSFPSVPRLFDAPDIALVSIDDINKELLRHKPYVN